MADRKISDLTALTAPAAGDFLPIVDISEAAAANKNKRITIEELFRGIPLGTAAAPSVAIEGDENTGIFSPGADQLAISTGGSGRVFVGSTGTVIRADNAGSGSTPLLIQNRSVSANTAVGISFAPNISDTADRSAIIYGVNSSGGSGNATDLAFHTNANGTTPSERMRITSTGALNFVGAGSAGSTQAVSFNGSAPVNSLVIDSSGRLGVGTTPDSRLHVLDGSGNSLRIGYLAGSLNYNLYDAGIHQFRNNGGTNTWATIDASGRLGIGTTSFDAGDILHVSGAADTRLRVGTTSTSAGHNAAIRLDATTNGKFTIQTGADTSGGLRVFDNNASAERARIDSSGRLGIGTTSPGAVLHTRGTGYNAIFSTGEVPAGSTAIALGSYADSAGGSSGATIRCYHNHGATVASSLAFEVNGATEAARIDGSGRLLVGTSSTFTNVYHATTVGIQAPVQIRTATNDYSTGTTYLNYSASGYAPVVTLGLSKNNTAGSNTAVASGDELGYLQFVGNDGTNFRTAAWISAHVDATPGSADMPGRLVFSTTADGASSPTERMRIGNDGALYIGSTSALDQTNGFYVRPYASGRYVACSSDGVHAAIFNRNTNDGSIVDLRQAGTTEGTISVSGSTVSYNGAHLSRWSQLPSGAERTEILRGSVLSNINEMCEWGDEENEQLNRMKVSDVEGDKNVSGVFQCWDDDDDTYTNDFYCAMTGDFIIRIAEGVTVERGDLLMSAGDGTAKPQDDDIIRSKTIAKVTSTNVSCTYEDGSYCVPCVLMAC